MKEMLYIIGAPGSGKTTCLAAALADVKHTVDTCPFAHTIYHVGLGQFIRGYQLGCQREQFGGTDVLPMNVQPKVEEWLHRTYWDDMEQCNVIVAEGDRLGNGKFFKSVLDAGWKLTVAWLCTDLVTRAQRCAARGSNQNLTWLKGRASKCARLGGEWADPKWCIDGEQSVEAVAARLRRHPVIRHLRGE